MKDESSAYSGARSAQTSQIVTGMSVYSYYYCSSDAFRFHAEDQWSVLCTTRVEAGTTGHEFQLAKGFGLLASVRDVP